jgi:hypothetical protein
MKDTKFGVYFHYIIEFVGFDNTVIILKPCDLACDWRDKSSIAFY